MSPWVAAVGQTREEIAHAGFDQPVSDLPGYFRSRTAEMRQRFGEHQLPTPAVRVLIPFFSYLDRCTTTNHRLLMTGFLPEVPFFAQRAFAGGQIMFMHGYYGSTENQQQVVSRLGRQAVPFALMPSDYEADFLTSFPTVAAYVYARYIPLTEVQIDSSTRIRILVDKDLPTASRDVVTGWPCYR